MLLDACPAGEWECAADSFTCLLSSFQIGCVKASNGFKLKSIATRVQHATRVLLQCGGSQQLVHWCVFVSDQCFVYVSVNTKNTDEFFFFFLRP